MAKLSKRKQQTANEKRAATIAAKKQAQQEELDSLTALYPPPTPEQVGEATPRIEEVPAPSEGEPYIFEWKKMDKAMFDPTYEIKTKAERATRAALVEFGNAQKAFDIALQVLQHAQEQLNARQAEQQELALTLSKIQK